MSKEKHAVAPASRNPDYSNPKEAPYPDMRWSRVKKLWLFIDRRTPAEKKRAREIKREEMKIDKIWRPVSKRIPRGWYPGVTCNLGWKDLIFKLVSQLDWVWEGFHKKFGPEECWLPVQVKEKFGGLRFYTIPGIKVSNGDSSALKAEYAMRWEVSRTLIEDAEHKSVFICEQCGGRGERRSISGGIATSCQPCYDVWLKRVVSRQMGSKYSKDRSYEKTEIAVMDEIEKKRRKSLHDTRTVKKGAAPRHLHARGHS